MRRGLRNEERGKHESGGGIQEIGMEGGFERQGNIFVGFWRIETRWNPTSTELGDYRIYRGSTMMLEELCAVGLASSLTEQEC